jgi:hypothetical protein
MAKPVDASGNPAKGADGKALPNIEVPGYGKRLYGYGAALFDTVNISQNEQKQIHPDGSAKDADILPDTVVTDKKSIEDKPQNPVVTQPQEPEDPKGKVVAEHRGYKIYEKKQGPWRTLTSYKGDATFHTGDRTSAAAQNIMIDIEKEYINETENEKIRNSTAALVTSPL